MGYENIRMVLEVNGEVVAQRMVRKYFNDVEDLKKKWHSMYALHRMKVPFDMYIEIRSEMQPQKRFKKDKKYITNYESEK